MRGDQKFLNDMAADEVFLDDALERRRVAPAVPRAFRIDDSNRAAFADLQTVRLRCAECRPGWRGPA